MPKEPIAQHLDLYYSSPKLYAAIIAGNKDIDYVPFYESPGIPNLIDAAH